GDLHTALRRLGTDRGFTLVAILALAIGIGVNNTFFTLVNAICLRGPIADPAGLVHIGTRSANGAEAGMSYADFVDARSAVRTLSDVAAYISTPAAVADDQHAADAI